MSLSNLLQQNSYNLYCNSLISIEGIGNARASVNPVSNPDPFTNGLIIPAGTGETKLPITFGPIELGPGSPYNYNPNNSWTLNNDSITVKPGKYFISFSLNILSYDPK